MHIGHNESVEKTPTISVIIPTLARPRPLARCLSALSRQDYPTDCFEVIVVDDGSEQPPSEVVAAFDGSLSVKLLQQTNAGPGAARNRGAAAARGELLAFTDDDCLPEPGWLSAFSSQYVAARGDLLGGRVINSDRSNLYAETSQLILESAYRFYAIYPGPGRFFASNNIAVPADKFAAVGGFDRHYRMASEDRDLCDRWLLADGKLRYVEDAIVRHHPQLDFGRFIRQYFRYGRGAWRYHRARRGRGLDQSAATMRLHGRYLTEVGRSLMRRPVPERLRVGALLMLWQWSNLAGYVTGAIKEYPRRGG